MHGEAEARCARAAGQADCRRLGVLDSRLRLWKRRLNSAMIKESSGAP